MLTADVLENNAALSMLAIVDSRGPEGYLIARGLPIALGQHLPPLDTLLSLRPSEIVPSIVAAIEQLNDVIYQLNLTKWDAKIPVPGSGRTLSPGLFFDLSWYDSYASVVVALLVGTTAILANTGNTRAYLVHPGSPIRLVTKDHAVVSLLAELNESSGTNPYVLWEKIRSNPYRDVLYQSVGRKPKVQVSTAVVTLAPGNTLILCSDGLWGSVPEFNLERIIENPVPLAGSPNDALREIAEQMITYSIAAGGEDDASVVLVQHNGEH